MDQSHRLSLIIPAYNEEEYIGPCLDAVLKNAQDIFFEIIVIDNASTDRTAEVAGKYQGVRVIHEPRKGLTRARQCGYTASSGDVLVYIDADTRPAPGWASQIYKAITKDPGIACVSGPYVFYDLPWYSQVTTVLWNWITKLLSYLLGYLIIGGNFAITRTVLEKMGGFDETIEFYGEDADIGRRAHLHGKVVYSLRLTMPASARRLKAMGLLRTANVYGKNLVSIVVTGRPATTEYEDFR